MLLRSCRVLRRIDATLRRPLLRMTDARRRAEYCGERKCRWGPAGEADARRVPLRRAICPDGSTDCGPSSRRASARLGLLPGDFPQHVYRGAELRVEIAAQDV